MLGRLLAPALAVALAAVAADAQRNCTRLPPDSSIFVGDPIGPEIPDLTLDECNSLCAADSKCVAFDWLPEYAPEGSYCLLSSLISIGTDFISSDFKGVVSGRCGPNLPTLNGDFPGNDLSNAPAADPTQCSYTCENTNGCVAYSWTSYNNGTCWMKKTIPSSTSAPFDGSVTSGAVFKCRALGEDTDILGGDLISVPRADWHDCCSVCLSTPGCKASSWSDYNGGTCWLKKDFARKNTKTAKGVRSVVVSSVWNGP